LIIGITGQVGAYLARHLLSKNYSIHGTSRDVAMARLDNLNALRLREKVTLHSLSLLDSRSIKRLIDEIRPAEIYNLSGQSSVALSFDQPVETIEGIVFGTLNILEAVRQHASSVRFYNAGSSECFGDTGFQAANELTAFRPKSPYGIAKVAAMSLVTNYREAYGLFSCSGILFNHESPLRPARFVTRKITAAAVRIAQGSRERLALGNLSIRRDWGWAPDYVEAMWAMLQANTPDDFIIATGVSHSLEEFVAAAFTEVGLNWRNHVDYDASFKRPNEIQCSSGDPTKAKDVLGWCAKTPFAEIITRMVRAEREGVMAIS
jgi:GDPmannose 4,6-dehydratase